MLYLSTQKEEFLMNSTVNGSVTYLLLQRLTENAWDDGEQERLYVLSQAVDDLCTDFLNREQERQQAVGC